jgi:protein involved in sex pheromone biosynthesis
MHDDVAGIRRSGEKTSSEASRKLTESVIDLIKENFGNEYTRLSATKKDQITRKLQEKYYSGIYQYLANKKNVNNSIAKVTVDIMHRFFSTNRVSAFSPFLYERIEAYLEEIYNT